MKTVIIPVEEYNMLQNQVNYLSNQDLLEKVNVLIDLMYERKYGLYLGDFTSDLEEISLNNVTEWSKSGDVWNEI